MEQVIANKPFGIKRSRKPHGDLRSARPGPRGHSHPPYASDREPVAGSLAGLGGCRGSRAGSSVPAAGLGVHGPAVIYCERGGGSPLAGLRGPTPRADPAPLQPRPPPLPSTLRSAPFIETRLPRSFLAKPVCKYLRPEALLPAGFPQPRKPLCKTAPTAPQTSLSSQPIGFPPPCTPAKPFAAPPASTSPGSGSLLPHASPRATG